MAFSGLDLTTTDRGNILTRLAELNQTPTEAVLQESNQVRLNNLTTHQLAAFSNFRGRVLGDIEQVQQPPKSGFPPLPGVSKPIEPCLAEPTEAPDPEAVLREQDSEGFLAYSQLRREEQRLFLDLCRDMGMQPLGKGMFGGLLGSGASAEEENPRFRINQNLINLLKSGKLKSKDSQGRSLLQVLVGLAGQEMGPNLNRQTVLSELCAQIDQPGIMTQGDRNTCGPATIEHLQASRDPAEYARIVAGLTSREGSVTLKNGETLNRDRGSLTEQPINPGTQVRSSVSRLYQAALMEYANGEDEYDNRTDVHTNADDSTRTGLRVNEFERAVDALFGDHYDFKSVQRTTAQGRTDAEHKIQRALSRGEQVPVLIEWDDLNNDNWSGHYLSVIGMTDSTVVLRNPWGAGDSGGSNGPSRDALDGQGTIEMSKQEFFSRLTNVALPKEA